MSIKKTSNMLTFAVDRSRPRFQNMFPLDTGHSVGSLTSAWMIPYWLDHFNIDYNTVDVDKATAGDWYPVCVNWWSLDHDYLGSLQPLVREKLQNGTLNCVFYYRETDAPDPIRQHIDKMCAQYDIDCERVVFISGNTTADFIPGCISFWNFDCQFWFESRTSPAIAISHAAKKSKITCLSRTHKDWREWFVFNIRRFASRDDYISYGVVENLARNDDVEFWDDYNLQLASLSRLQSPDQAWRDRLPITVDHLDQTQHNNHSLVVPQLYQDSYWNIVLETMLDADGTDGVFITEKTLKPIRNGQPFVILGCAGSLEYLRSHGYKTFAHAIDESYDQELDVHLRWLKVYHLTKWLLFNNQSQLHATWNKTVDVLAHNQRHFQRSRQPALEKMLCQLKTLTP